LDRPTVLPGNFNDFSSREGGDNPWTYAKNLRIAFASTRVRFEVMTPRREGVAILAKAFQV
jgi:hypothetical protein